MPIGLYVHVPYCRRRCPYCDFLSRATPGHAPSEYVAAVARQIRGFEGPDEARTLFFGGGTPSLLREADLEAILEGAGYAGALSDPEYPADGRRERV